LTSENQTNNAKTRLITQYLIEQFNQHLIDMSCNEFNVFYLNSTEVKLEDGYYTKWENEIMKIIDQNLSKFKQIQTQTVINMNDQIFNIFIPRTQSAIRKKVLNYLINKTRVEVINEFKAFHAKSSVITIPEAEGYFKMFGDLVEENEEKLLELLMNTIISESKITTKYKVIQFLNECRRKQYSYYVSYITLTQYVKSLSYETKLSNTLILEENTKKNIQLDFPKTSQLLYSYLNLNSIKIDNIVHDNNKYISSYMSKEDLCLIGLLL